MYIDQRKRVHIWQLLLVVAGVAIFTTIEMYVPVFSNQLVGTPFIVIAVLAALYGDYYTGLAAIVLSTLGVIIVGSNNLQFISHSIVRASEFLLASVVIYYLAWRSRDLTRDTASLINTVIHLQDVAKRQSKDAKIDKKQLAKLRAANRELLDIVDVVMDDKGMWANSVKTEIRQTDKLTPSELKSKKSPQKA